MTQTRTLLAATDFSTPARHALERAAMLAQAHSGSRLILAHIVSRSALDNLHRLLSQDAAELEARMLDQAESTLNNLAAQLERGHACAIDTVLKQGSAPTALVDLAEDLQTELLVMGARGVHFVRERLLGSTTGRVLRTSRRPLLAVKQRPHAAYRRILAAVDFSDHAAASRPATTRSRRWKRSSSV